MNQLCLAYCFCVLLLDLLSFCQFTNSKSSNCELDLDKRSGKEPPFILDKGILYPENNTRTLSIESGAKLSLFCPGHNNSFKSSKDNDSSVEYECKEGQLKKEGNGKKVNFKTMSCKMPMIPEIKRKENSKCSKGCDAKNCKGKKTKNVMTEFDVGWTISKKFTLQYSVCMDETLYGTLWSKHVIRGASLSKKSATGRKQRPDFQDEVDKETIFSQNPDFDFDKPYSKKEQKKTVSKLLDTNKLPSGKTIMSSSKFYFVRGHLVPDAEFVYNAESDATYFYINVAPQYQALNNGNWKAMEISTRDYAQKSQSDITIYTGTWEILEYPNKKGDSTQLYLYADPESSEKMAIPVPKYFWRLVHDEKKDESFAFIAFNDPHVNETESFCKSICDNLDWVDWPVNDVKKGLMNCCKTSDLRKKIPFVPKL